MRNWKTFLFLGIGVFLIQIVSGIVIALCFSTWTDRGTFGDMFGAVNTLFSGLAFAGVIYAIILQQQELTLQREELKMTREELNRTATAQEHSEKALAEQAKTAILGARLSAANILLEDVESKLDKLPIPGRPIGGKTRPQDINESRRSSLTKQRDSLKQDISRIYRELSV